jgi:hypothetical protein
MLDAATSRDVVLQAGAGLLQSRIDVGATSSDRRISREFRDGIG